MAGGVEPDRPRGQFRAAGQRLGRAVGGAGRDRIVQQGGDQQRRHHPGVAALGVDHAQLQPAARSDRWKQRGQVVLGIVQRRPALRGVAAQPGPQRCLRRRGPRHRLRAAQAEQPRVERIAGPGGARVVVGLGRAGAPRVHMRPDGLPGRPPSGRDSLPQRGVGKGGDQYRAQPVHQRPAEAVAGGAMAVRGGGSGRQRAGVLPGVDVHLDGGGGAHHHPAPVPGGVEVRLHRPVARQVEDALGGAVGLKAAALQHQAGRRQGRAQLGQVGGSLLQAADGAGGRARAQLHLPAGLQGDPAPVRQPVQRPQLGQRCPQPLDRHRSQRVQLVADQPFQLDPGAPGRTGLEADPGDVRQRLVLPEPQASHGAPLRPPPPGDRFGTCRVSVEPARRAS